MSEYGTYLPPIQGPGVRWRYGLIRERASWHMCPVPDCYLIPTLSFVCVLPVVHDVVEVGKHQLCFEGRRFVMRARWLCWHAWLVREVAPFYDKDLSHPLYY